MKLTLLREDKKANKLIFSLKDADVGFANALRRAAIEEVPTMAMEDLEIRKNSSALYDEMLGLRMGLVPLTTDLESYSLPVEGEEPSARTHLKLTLKATGPGYVYASQIESQDPKVKPVFPEMIIAKLLKGQKVEVEATAVLGRGKEHAKWAPGLIYYRYKQNVKVSGADPKEVLAQAPAGVFTEKGGKVVVNEDALLDIDLAGALDDVKGVEVTEDPNEFIFTVESWGQLPPRDIMARAAEEVAAQLNEMEGLL